MPKNGVVNEYLQVLLDWGRQNDEKMSRKTRNEQSRATFLQNLGGQTQSIIVFSELAYRVLKIHAFRYETEISRVITYIIGVKNKYSSKQLPSEGKDHTTEK